MSAKPCPDLPPVGPYGWEAFPPPPGEVVLEAMDGRRFVISSDGQEIELPFVTARGRSDHDLFAGDDAVQP